MSALLLQLLQASGHGTIKKVRKLKAKALDAEVLEAGGDKVDIALEVRLENLYRIDVTD